MSKSDQSSEPTLQFTTIASGNSSLIELLAIPIAGELEKTLPKDGFVDFSKERGEELNFNALPTANYALVHATVGVLLFIAGSFASNIIADIYKAKVKPIVDRILDSADDKFNQNNLPKAYEAGFWYGEEKVIIYIAIIEKTFGEIVKYHFMIPEIHQNAIKWIQKNNRGKFVHLYKVENGSVNLVPLLFDSLAEAKAKGIGK
jgi:hypothetical protein